MMLTLVLGTTFSFSSCGSDDDEDDPENGSTNTKGHNYVDLGLPSGTKWATCNIGATNPENCGEYYAWGETEHKTSYNEINYKFYDSSKYAISSESGKTTLELSDDVAHVKWGGNWHIPSYDEFEELKNNCVWTWTTLNGMSGYEVKSLTNNNSIFLPAAGFRNDKLSETNTDGLYWTSTIRPIRADYPASIVSFNFRSNWIGFLGGSGSTGRPIRPVCK